MTLKVVIICVLNIASLLLILPVELSVLILGGFCGDGPISRTVAAAYLCFAMFALAPLVIGGTPVLVSFILLTFRRVNAALLLSGVTPATVALLIMRWPALVLWP